MDANEANAAYRSQQLEREKKERLRASGSGFSGGYVPPPPWIDRPHPRFKSFLGWTACLLFAAFVLLLGTGLLRTWLS